MMLAQVGADIEGVSQAAQEEREPGAKDVVDRATGKFRLALIFKRPVESNETNPAKKARTANVA